MPLLRTDHAPSRSRTKGNGYVVRGMAFSPDSTKLAVAQSDNIVFVYRLGAEWGEKKSICNKFQARSAARFLTLLPTCPLCVALRGVPWRSTQDCLDGGTTRPLQVSSSVTTVVWPAQSPNHLFFGTSEGKIYVGNLRTNKADAILKHPEGSYVVSLAAGPDGLAMLSGHVDGSIIRFSAQEGLPAEPLARHDCPPYALGWGHSIVAAGSDCKVSFLSAKGSVSKQFSFVGEESGTGGREFSCCCVSPGGDTVALGSYDRLLLFKFNSKVREG